MIQFLVVFVFVVVTGPSYAACTKEDVDLGAFIRDYVNAMHVALEKLQSNSTYLFQGEWLSQLSGGHVRLDGVEGWQSTACITPEGNPGYGLCFQPEDGQLYEAIQGVSDSWFPRAECNTGLQLAQYAVLAELFGRSLDNYFDHKEFYVGSDVSHSQSVLFQTEAGQEADLSGVNRARAVELLIGATGYLGNVFGGKFLDRPDSRGQNFLIVETSLAGITSLSRRGGAQAFSRTLRKIWELSQSVSPQEKIRMMSLLDQGRRVPRELVDPAQHRLVMMLEDHFLRDTYVYVHPLGIKNLAWHVMRLTLHNPRTPYSIEFYPNTLHGEIFSRWREMKGACDQ